MKTYQEILKKIYPECVRFTSHFAKVQLALNERGFYPENTLLTNSICRDETNKSMLTSLASYWGNNFELAGLAGIPTAGLTGIAAYTSHMPENGKLIVIYGPHIGMSHSGDLGVVTRKGLSALLPTCGSLGAYVKKITEDLNYTPEFSPLDVEQFIVESSLDEHKKEIQASAHPLKQATEVLYKKINEKVITLFTTTHADVEVALIGGIMINTDFGYDDFWVPISHEIMKNDLSITEFV